jgi:flagellar biosynthesis protein FliR
MITLTSAQLDGWIAMLIWPLTRILALIASAPVTGNAQFPVTAKIGLAAALTVLVAPLLPVPSAIDPASGAGLLLLTRELLIGLAMGLAMRVVFAGVSMAGDIIGLQMGLGFAQFYDPQSNAQAPVTGQFLGLIATLVFLALNGHLMMIATLVESFQHAPPDAAGGLGGNGMRLAQWGGTILRAALLLSLPLIAVLLVTNIALGVLSRAAAQLNIFAIGFPITLGIGFITLLITLPSMTPVLEKLFHEGLQAMLRVAALGGR